MHRHRRRQAAVDVLALCRSSPAGTPPAPRSTRAPRCRCRRAGTGCLRRCRGRSRRCRAESSSARCRAGCRSCRARTARAPRRGSGRGPGYDQSANAVSSMRVGERRQLARRSGPRRTARRPGCRPTCRRRGRARCRSPRAPGSRRCGRSRAPRRRRAPGRCAAGAAAAAGGGAGGGGAAATAATGGGAGAGGGALAQPARPRRAEGGQPAPATRAAASVLSLFLIGIPV